MWVSIDSGPQNALSNGSIPMSLKESTFSHYSKGVYQWKVNSKELFECAFHRIYCKTKCISHACGIVSDPSHNPSKIW